MGINISSIVDIIGSFLYVNLLNFMFSWNMNFPHNTIIVEIISVIFLFVFSFFIFSVCFIYFVINSIPNIVTVNT